mgnify:CR=1 FL=1
MTVLAAVFVFIVYMEYSSQMNMMDSGGMVEIITHIESFNDGVEEQHLQTMNRIFVFTNENNELVFYEGEDIYKNFVIVNKNEIENMSSNFIRFGKTLVIKRVIDDKTWYGGFEQSIEYEDSMIQVKRIAFILVGVFVLIFIMIVVSSRFIFKPVEEMMQKQKEFVQNASHELKTPITTILSCESLLKEDYPDNEWLDMIASESKHMQGIVSNMLTLVGAYKDDAALDTVDLTELINNKCLSMEAVAFEKDIDFKYDIAEDQNIVGDSKAFDEIVTSLLDNAFKYCSFNKAGDKYIYVCFKDYIFTIENTGGSIEEDEQEKIFERFYRGIDARNQFTGSGLGLSIVKEICDRFGFEITLNTEKEEYTEFRIRFKI